MRQSHNYEKCYNLLNINRDCSWNDLKKEYRTLIKKWHPDRYINDKEKEQATEKLKNLNTAYKQLKDYYNKHGVLPLSLPLVSPIQSTSVNKEHFNYNKTIKKTQVKKSTVKTNRKNNILYIITISTLFILMYQYLDMVIIELSTQPVSPDKHQFRKNSIHDNKSDTKKNIPPKIETKYFTYGSTIADVILAQGPPDNMIGDIWFYGKSEVHFKDGRVIKWLRTTNKLLNVRVDMLFNRKNFKNKNQ